MNNIYHLIMNFKLKYIKHKEKYLYQKNKDSLIESIKRGKEAIRKTKITV